MMKPRTLVRFAILGGALCWLFASILTAADRKEWYDLTNKVYQDNSNDFELSLYSKYTSSIKMDLDGTTLQVRWQTEIDPNGGKSDRDHGLISVTADVQKRIEGNTGTDGYYESSINVVAYNRADPQKKMVNNPAVGIGTTAQGSMSVATDQLNFMRQILMGLDLDPSKYQDPNAYYPFVFVSQGSPVTKQYSYMTLKSASQTMPGEANVGNQFVSYVNMSMDVPNIEEGVAYRVRVTFYGSDHKAGGGYQHFNTKAATFDRIFRPLPDNSGTAGSATATKGPGVTAHLNAED